MYLQIYHVSIMQNIIMYKLKKLGKYCFERIFQRIIILKALKLSSVINIDIVYKYIYLYLLMIETHNRGYNRGKDVKQDSDQRNPGWIYLPCRKSHCVIMEISIGEPNYQRI